MKYRQFPQEELTAERILAILEEYLTHTVPGWTQNDALAAGMPRSERSNVLTNALWWKFGGQWETVWAGGSALHWKVCKGWKTSTRYWEAEYTLSPVLARFLLLTGKLHTGPNSRVWYGDVTYGEARRALQRAKEEEEKVR